MLPTLRPEADHPPAERPNGVAQPGRIDLLDAVRGIAVLGMVAFHLDWDLAYFGYVQTPPMASSAWSAFGQIVATAFLMLSGVGLVLARGRGLPHALGRIARIAGCAAAITAMTAWLFPQEVVSFGILHCIAATNLIALPLLRTRVAWVMAVAAAALLAPVLLTTGLTEGSPWWWLGISTAVPRTLDYRPLLPWLGFTLLGVVTGRNLPLNSIHRLTRPWMASPLWRALGLVGRHSLLTYLMHQPVLFGLLWLVTPAPAPDSLGAFIPACQAECQAAGASAAGCKAACTCAEQQLARSQTGHAKGPAASDPPADIAEQCVRRRP